MAGRSQPPRQLPLDLAHGAGSSREDLVVTPANAAATALIDRWPDWPSAVIALVGPPGSGKSHLAAIWQQTAGARALGADALANRAVSAARDGPVLVEDADGCRLDEAGLFHLINAARGAGSSMLLTARRLPPAWPVTLPDLASRLRAATVVEIGEPDDALLAGVIVKLFADRQIAVDPSVVTYMVRRIERSLATANDLVQRIDQAALEQKAAITRQLAGQVIGAFDEGRGGLEL